MLLNDKINTKKSIKKHYILFVKISFYLIINSRIYDSQQKILTKYRNFAKFRKFLFYLFGFLRNEKKNMKLLAKIYFYINAKGGTCSFCNYFSAMLLSYIFSAGYILLHTQ